MQEKKIVGKSIDRITVKSLPVDAIPALLNYCTVRSGGVKTLAGMCHQILMAVAQMYPVPPEKAADMRQRAQFLIQGIKLVDDSDWLSESSQELMIPWLEPPASKKVHKSGKTPQQEAAFQAMYPGEIDAWAPEPETPADQPPTKKKLSNDILKGVYYTIRGMGKKRFLTMKDAIKDLKDLVESGYPCPFERLTQQEWVDWVGAGNDQIYQIHEDFMPLSSLTAPADPEIEYILTDEWLAAHDITRPSGENSEIE